MVTAPCHTSPRIEPRSIYSRTFPAKYGTRAIHGGGMPKVTFMELTSHDYEHLECLLGKGAQGA